MAFLSGRFVRQTIVDAFRPGGLFATARTRGGTRLAKCVTRHRDDSYWRGFSCRDQYLWSGRIVHDSDIGPNGVRGALPRTRQAVQSTEAPIWNQPQTKPLANSGSE